MLSSFLSFSFSFTKKAFVSNLEGNLCIAGCLSRICSHFNVYFKDSGKSKTREELLAEERDYKRRRMSYRGKKAKRNRTEVCKLLLTDSTDTLILMLAYFSWSEKNMTQIPRDQCTVIACSCMKIVYCFHGLHA